jgi:hypothetical protein
VRFALSTLLLPVPSRTLIIEDINKLIAASVSGVPSLVFPDIIVGYLAWCGSVIPIVVDASGPRSLSWVHVNVVLGSASPSSNWIFTPASSGISLIRRGVFLVPETRVVSSA